MTVRDAAALLIVVLMIRLRFPESGGLSQSRSYAISLLLQNPYQLCGCLILLLIENKNFRAILLADIRPLAIELGEIVGLKKKFGQFFKRGLLRIKKDFHSFRMAGIAAAHVFVSGLERVTANESDRCSQYPFHFLEMELRSPKTSRSENGSFASFWISYGNKNKGDRIHAMTGFLGSEAFAKKNMAKVCPTSGADDFCPPAVRIAHASDCARDLSVEARPAAFRSKLISGTKKR